MTDILLRGSVSAAIFILTFSTQRKGHNVMVRIKGYRGRRQEKEEKDKTKQVVEEKDGKSRETLQRLTQS